MRLVEKLQVINGLDLTHLISSLFAFFLIYRFITFFLIVLSASSSCVFLFIIDALYCLVTNAHKRHVISVD